MTILNKKSSVVLILNRESLVSNDLEIKLLKKANELTNKGGRSLKSIIIGSNIDKDIISKVSKYCDEVIIFDNKKLKDFNEGVYTALIKEFINKDKPGFLLMNNNDFGKIISSRVAGYLDCSVMTNCNDLSIDNNGNLTSKKIIENNNIEITFKDSKTQIATLDLKKIRLEGKIIEKDSVIIVENLNEKSLNSTVEIIEHNRVEEKMSIDKAEVLVVAGKGVKREEDLDLIYKLAKKISGEVAFTRPLVQMGWAEHINQVGISGTTVMPKLIVTVGVSGAIQFTNAMNKSKKIVSINNDPKAPIFKLADVGIVGDLYEIIPRLLDRLN